MGAIFSLIPAAAAAAAKSLQSCPTPCNPIDGSPPGSSIPGILQARILEWVAISFSSDESEKWNQSCSVVSDSQRPHGPQHQAPPSMGFSRQEYWKWVTSASSILTPYPAFIVCRPVDDGHSDWHEMIPYCGFDLHFSNNEWFWASFHVFISHLYEGYGNPLQYSCLENSRDRGAWWVTIYGVTKCWTPLRN